MIFIVLLLTSILYYSYQQTTLPIMYDQVSENLQQTGYSANYMMESVNNLLSQMYLDSKITTLMYSNNNHNAFDLNNGLKALTAYKHASPFVHSIYVYSSSLDSYFTSISNTALVKKDVFFDEDITGLIENYDTSNKMKPIPRMVKLISTPLVTDKYVECYTFIYYETLESGKIKDAIIVNVNQSYVKDMMNALNTSIVNKKYVIDYDGNSLLSNNEFELNTNLSDLNYVKVIQDSDLTKGYFVITIGDEKSLVSYNKLSVPKWIVINIIPFDYISNQLAPVKGYTLLISFTLLALSIVLYTLLSRYKYKPIKEVYDDVSLLEDDRRSNLYNNKQLLLRALIKSHTAEVTRKKIHALKDYNLVLDPSKDYQMILLSIDAFKSFAKDNPITQQELMKFSMANVANELLSKSYNSVCIDMLGPISVILVESKTDNPSEINNPLTPYINSLQETISRLFNISLSVVIGPKKTHLSNLSIHYNELLQALEYSFVLGFRCIISYDELADKGLTSYELNASDSKKLVESLMTGRCNEAILLYESLLDASRGCTIASIKYTHIQLMFSINEALMYLKTSMIMENYDLNEIVDYVNGAEYIGDVEVKFKALFDYINTRIKDLHQPKHIELIDSIKKHINSNYFDMNLTLNSIADEYEISPLYVGRIFKQQIGQSIANYIIDVRITISEDLLKNTNHTITEIADMIGITNTNYFYSLFKKKYGITPTTYRKKSNK